MPNFRVKNIKNKDLPFEKDGICFVDIAKGRVVDLVLAKAKDEMFFITIKPGNDMFVVKGEKLTRPAKVGLLQKALEVFRDEFCEGVISPRCIYLLKCILLSMLKFLNGSAL